MPGTDGEVRDGPAGVEARGPQPLTEPARQLHRSVLVALVLIGLVRGLFWVGLVELWSPIDEAAHFAYVESLATGKGIPVVGEDLVSAEVLEVAKAAPTFFARSRPFRADPEQAVWGGTREQYEAIQGPSAYAVLVPAYWLGRPFGIVAAAYAVRIGTLLTAVAAIPLTWLLARQLLPRRPEAWLAAAGLLAFVNGFNANLATTTNDALLVSASTAAAAVFIRLRWRSRTTDAVLAGTLFGLAVVTKSTAMALVPFLGLAFVWILCSRRHRVGAMASWAGAFVGTALLVVLPWVGFNLVSYGAVSGAEAVEKVTGDIQARSEFGLDGLGAQLVGARIAFWELQPRTQRDVPYRVVWEVATVASLALGIVGAGMRRRWSELRALGWAALALPGALLTLLVIVYGVFGGVGTAIGRHYYVGLVPTLVVIAGGTIVALGARLGLLAVLALVLVATAMEVGAATTYAERAYTTGIVGGEVPVVEQSWADAEATFGRVVFAPRCPVTTVGLFSATAPDSISVGRQAAPEVGEQGGFTLYRLPTAAVVPTTLVLPTRPFLTYSRTDREPSVALPERPGADPVIRLYCEVQDPKGYRFEQLHSVQHLDLYTYGAVSAWISGWAWAAGIALVAAAVAMAVGRTD